MHETMTEAEEIAIRARESISEYCMNECHAYCCRKGYLELTKEELSLITGERKKELESRNAIDFSQNETYLLDLSVLSCPSLKESMCTIHKNPSRPKACKEFPIFLWDHKILRLSNRCPAVREEKLYPFVTQLIRLGYKFDSGPELILD